LHLPVSGGERPPTDTDLIGTNWADAYSTASDGLLAAWRQRGTAGTLQLGRGEVAATCVSGMHLFSETVHGWDLASATGQSTDLDPEVGQAALDFARDNLERFRGRASAPRFPCPRTRHCMTVLPVSADAIPPNAAC
jgi:uncharacterized protein (TIGR03086 family)